MADVSFVENFINGFAIVSAAMRFAHYAGMLGWRNGFGHVTPHSKHGAEPAALRLPI
jgi:hypothetical protein